ncbi:hypothetical protein C8241_03615 [Paracidovorax avenae]|nr:hypothetical protein C8241_03615 [Paracidovorax avenae]
MAFFSLAFTGNISGAMLFCLANRSCFFICFALLRAFARVSLNVYKLIAQLKSAALFYIYASFIHSVFNGVIDSKTF